MGSSLRDVKITISPCGQSQETVCILLSHAFEGVEEQGAV